MASSPGEHLDEVNRFCGACGRPRAPEDTRCSGCGNLVRVGPRAWTITVAVIGALQVGWTLLHGRSLVEALGLGLLEAGLVAAVLAILIRRVGTLNRRGRASYGLSFVLASLVTAAICVAIYPAMGDSGLPGAVTFAVTILGMPLLIGALAAVPLSRGWRTHVPASTCGRCGMDAPPTAAFCVACGGRMAATG